MDNREIDGEMGEKGRRSINDIRRARQRGKLLDVLDDVGKDETWTSGTRVLTSNGVIIADYTGAWMVRGVPAPLLEDEDDNSV